MQTITICFLPFFTRTARKFLKIPGWIALHFLLFEFEFRTLGCNVQHLGEARVLRCFIQTWNTCTTPLTQLQGPALIPQKEYIVQLNTSLHFDP